MSGQIRTSLGRSRKWAQDNLLAYVKYLEDNQPPWSNELKVNFIVHSNKLQKYLNYINGDFEKWKLLIEGIQDETARDTEQNLFDVLFDSNDYHQLIEKLEDSISWITEWIKISEPVEESNQL